MKRRSEEEPFRPSYYSLENLEWLNKLWSIYKHMMLTLPFIIEHRDINRLIMDTILSILKECTRLTSVVNNYDDRDVKFLEY
jgi:hypothetical protein